MKEKEHFDATMDHYLKQVGKEAGRELYLIYNSITEWLITDGWGDIKLSAIQHRFSRKFRVNAVKKVKKHRLSY